MKGADQEDVEEMESDPGHRRKKTFLFLSDFVMQLFQGGPREDSALITSEQAGGDEGKAKTPLNDRVETLGGWGVDQKTAGGEHLLFGWPWKLSSS